MARAWNFPKSSTLAPKNDLIRDDINRQPKINFRVLKTQPFYKSVTAETRADGNNIKYAYDAFGRLIAAISKIHYATDAQRILKKEYQDGESRQYHRLGGQLI